MHGPCEPWEFLPECCDVPESASQELIAKQTAVSTTILFDAGGRRHGPCPVTVRPCLRRCGGGVRIGFPFWPYKDGEGAWRNIASCSCVGDCSCSELCEIVLEGPVASVEEVLIDGAAVDADTYRLDLVNGEYRLLRTNGECWPSCQDVTADCDEEGAFCVTYLKGLDLDELALSAHSELVCELIKACVPDCKTCRLPKNVVSVVRRGVSLTFENSKAWLTTLPMVAAWIEAVNPRGLISSPGVWSPDISETRIAVVTEGS